MIEEYRDWFDTYVRSFRSEDREFQQNIKMKEKHTLRVCDEILALGGKNWDYIPKIFAWPRCWPSSMISGALNSMDVIERSSIVTPKITPPWE